MAGISTSIQLNDGMSSVIQSIINSMSMMTRVFESAQDTVSNAVDTSMWDACNQEIIQASASLTRYREELDRTRNTSVPEPILPEPTWNSVKGQSVFMNTGSERFASELQAADQMAQQLYQRQLSISTQARKMTVIPPGMLNDVAATSNRIEQLGARIRELNQIPVELRTDGINGELEALRSKLGQACDIQEELTRSVADMDVGRVNADYQRLNQILDTGDRIIRDNITAQDEFNHSVQAGRVTAAGLGGELKKYAAMLLGTAGMGKALNLSDEVTQTTARLNLIVEDGGSVQELEDKIFASAQRSRGSYLQMADAVSKLGAQAADAFSSNDELIAFTEQLNKQFIIAGAGTSEIQNATLQLTQALASGVLRGDELNSIFKQAPTIIQSIADYMDVPMGKIREMASEGKLTADIVKNAMLAAADDTNEKFSRIPMTFGQVATSIQNQALVAFQPALEQLSAVAQSAEFAALVDGISQAIGMIAEGVVSALDMMGQMTMFVAENWSILVPVIGGVLLAIGAYKLAVLGAIAVENIQKGIHAASIVLQFARAAITRTQVSATTAETAAQMGLNTALLACPLTWIVLAILVAITAIYAIVGAINHFKGTAISATGIIAGVFAVLGAHIINTFVIPIWNQFASIANFIGNLFNDPVAAVKILFLDLAQTVIGYIANMAHAIENVINKIPGVKVDITSGLDGFQEKLEDTAAKVKSESEWVEYVEQKDFINYDDAAKAGYKFGQGIEDKVKNVFGNKEEEERGPEEDPLAGTEIPDYSQMVGNTGETAANTAVMSDQMDLAEEELKSMRDMAEQEVINRFTTAELTVQMGGITNQINSQMDLDGIGDYLGSVIYETLETAAEGVH